MNIMHVKNTNNAFINSLGFICVLIVVALIKSDYRHSRVCQIKPLNDKNHIMICDLLQ